MPVYTSRGEMGRTKSRPVRQNGASSSDDAMLHNEVNVANGHHESPSQDPLKLDNGNNDNAKGSRFAIKLTATFLLASLASSTMAAFGVGCVARLVLLSNLGLTDTTGGMGGVNFNGDGSNAVDASGMLALPGGVNDVGTGGMSKKEAASSMSSPGYEGQHGTTVGGAGKPNQKRSVQLPAPKVIEGKDVPFTTYASKTFPMAGAATSNTLHIDRSDVLLPGKGGMTRSRREFDGGPDFSGDGDGDGDAAAAAAGGEEGGEGGTEANEDDYMKDNNGEGWTTCPDKTCKRGKGKPGNGGGMGNNNNNNNGDSGSAMAPKDYSSHNDDSDGLHLPAGQHLLVDIKDVDSNFLNSEERLARAMIELINESRLTLLSYHCHSLVPVGVSCAGVLLESHVAFHTWPMEGVITLDLFTCGGGLLIPTLPSIERLFGVPSSQEGTEGERDDEEEGGAGSEWDAGETAPQPTMLWSHKLRGFREGFAPGYVRRTNALDGSLGRYVLGKLDFDMKAPLLTTKTSFWSVNVYEVMDVKSRDYASYSKSLGGVADGSEGEDDDDEEDARYYADHPESFGPNKLLFLDDVLRTTAYGDSAHHESAVHPAMVSHSNPRRVAIVGEGGECGATLREVLKHESVEEVVLFEPDEELLEVCAEYLPEWSDCADFGDGGDSGSCFDDPRVRVEYVDGLRWFVDAFGVDGKEGEVEKKFDVVIMNSLLRGDDNARYASFVDSLSRGLSDDGVFVAQLGESKQRTSPADGVGRFEDRALMIDALERSGFQSVHTYDEGHSDFYMPWSYLVAFRDYESRASWYRTAPALQIELRRRLRSTRSGKPILKYFDAATMVRYQTPSKATETSYCRRDDGPYECEEYRGFHPEDENYAARKSVAVGKSRVADRAGRGLFAAVDILADRYIGIEGSVKAVNFHPSTFSVIRELYDWGEEVDMPGVYDELEAVPSYMEGYGWGSILMGKLHFSVETDVMMFMNHGCNGTYNHGSLELDDRERFSEQNLDVENLDEITTHLVSKAVPYSPVFERNLQRTLHHGDYTLQDIKKGEEITTNYLSYVGEINEFKRELLSLQKQCAREGVGMITEYEEYEEA